MRDIEKLRQNQKNFYWRHKQKVNEKQKEKILCDVCNYHITRTNLSHHKKSKKHLQNL